MFINNKPTINISLDKCKLFADGIHYINTFQMLLAYATFSYLYQNTKEKSVALLYNMALCHHQAKEYSKAIAMLVEAQMRIASPSVLQNPTNHLPSNLLTDEYENSYYHLALNETAEALNNDIIKLRINRFLVDIHLQLQNWQEIVRLSALPEMEKCTNVQEALIEVKAKR